MCVLMGIFVDIRRKVPRSPHGLAATVVSRTDRVRGVFFTDSNLPTNGTSSSFFFFFPRCGRDVQKQDTSVALATSALYVSTHVHRCKRRCLT